MRPYDVLAEVYDRWTGENDYTGWAHFLEQFLGEPGPNTRLLDVCCGTGRLTALLQRQGYDVAGVDGSAAMLAEAAKALSPGTPLLRADLTDGSFDAGILSSGPREHFDAALCTFDSVNHFTGDGDLQALFAFVAQALRPGGVFVFDVNTRHKLETIFGDSHYGDDHGEFAYVWRNRYDPAARTTCFLITLFTRDGEMYRRGEEELVQRWYTHEEIIEGAHKAGFTVRSVTDDYSMRPVAPETLRETWVLMRDGDS